MIHYQRDVVQLFFTVLIPPTIFIAVMANAVALLHSLPTSHDPTQRKTGIVSCRLVTLKWQFGCCSCLALQMLRHDLEEARTST